MKDTPFVYPKDRHIRREEPPQYKTRRSYKPFLRREFEQKCVYCRMPDTMKGQESFAVEHYLPKNKYPHLEHDYRNLFYACLPCNSNKGDFCPDPKHPAKGVFIPNPCEHSMFEHLRFRAEKVEARSKEGVFTKELLGLDDDEVTRYRAFIIGTIKLVKSKIDDLQETLDLVKQKGAPKGISTHKLRKLRQEVEVNLQQQQASLDRLLGIVRE